MRTVGRDGFSLISLLAVVFFIDWKWSLIAFLGIPFLVLPILLLQGLVRSRAGENRDYESKANVRLDEIFHGITDIKLNRAEGRERNKFFDILQLHPTQHYWTYMWNEIYTMKSATVAKMN